MKLLISIPAALLGSLLGSAARAGVAMAQARLAEKDDVASMADAADDAAINVTISPTAGLMGGALGAVLGVRLAFWAGAVVGAAGVDRLDAMLLGRVGIDMDALVARATEAATRARSAAPDEAA
jgi:predicted MFS family arabinose efflux permease